MLLQGALLPHGLALVGHRQIVEGGLAEQATGSRIAAQRGGKLAQHDALAVTERSFAQLHLTQLQLVARNVVLQRDTLCPALLHQLHHLPGQPDVGGIDGLPVAQVVELQVVGCEQKVYALPGLLGREVGHAAVLPGQLRAGRECAAGIDSLFGTEHEVVAKVRHGGCSALSELAVPQAGIAQIGQRQLGRHLRQTGHAGRALCGLGLAHRRAQALESGILPVGLVVE